MTDYKNRAHQELDKDFLQDGDNWILTEVANRPHDVLIDNIEIMRTKIDNLANKSGLNIEQQKNTSHKRGVFVFI